MESIAAPPFSQSVYEGQKRTTLLRALDADREEFDSCPRAHDGINETLEALEVTDDENPRWERR